MIVGFRVRLCYVVGILANDGAKLFLLNGILDDACEESCLSRNP